MNYNLQSGLSWHEWISNPKNKALYEWNQSVQNFLASHPTKAIKVNSRICDYEPKAKLFVGYENKLIQEGGWKDEDGMRGKMVKVKSFRY